MEEKTVKILAIKTPNTYPNIPSFIIEELRGIDCKVTTGNVEAREADLIEEICCSVKRCDAVLFIGGLGPPHSRLVWRSVSKVFHQDLIENRRLVNYVKSREEYATLYAKCLECETNGTFPVMYVQGLFLLTNDEKSLRSSIVNILLPFLKQLNNGAVYKRKLTLDVADGLSRLDKDHNVQVSLDIKSDSVKLYLKSSDMSALLNYESKLDESYKILDRCEDTDIENLVYDCRDPHVKKSVECIEECFERYGFENVFVSFNGGKDCTVLLHLTIAVLRRNYPNNPGKICCLYIENANPFPELNKFIEQCERYYDLEVIKFTKSIKDSLNDVLIDRPNMKAVLMGTRRSDPFSEHLQPFHMTDRNWPQVMRVSPILDWHYSEIWDYLLRLKVPYCSLYDEGYTSLGSTVNTIRNPFLVVDEGDGKQRHLPAYKLLDASQERSGRLSC